MRTLDAHPKTKSHKYAQGIVHDGDARVHNAVLDTGYQQSMVSMGSWEIIKRHDAWIDSQVINMGGYSKAGRRLQLVDTRVVANVFLDGKQYLVIVRKALFNPNTYKTLLVE